jgi:hypothetical protein
MIWLAKASLLLQLIHIFATRHVGFIYWSIHALIWINFTFYLGLPFALYFECSPREKIWNPHLPGHCINIEAYFVATSVFNIVRLQYGYYIYNGYLVITRPWFGFNHSRITMVWVISNNQPIYLKPTRSTIRISIPYSILKKKGYKPT